MERYATFSSDRKYRYSLTRTWDNSKPSLVIIGLNPSTADETKDDPTIRRCVGYAKEWGFGSLTMLNIFAYRSTNPKNLNKTNDPIGPENNSFINRTVQWADLVVAAWGTHGNLMNRGYEIKKMIKNLHVLGLTKEGHPKHPLYLKKDLKPIKW